MYLADDTYKFSGNILNVTKPKLLYLIPRISVFIIIKSTNILNYLQNYWLALNANENNFIF